MHVRWKRVFAVLQLHLLPLDISQTPMTSAKYVGIVSSVIIHPTAILWIYQAETLVPMLCRMRLLIVSA